MTVRAGDWKVGEPAVVRTSWATLSGFKFTRSLWKSEVVPASELVSAEVLGSESHNAGKVRGALVGGVLFGTPGAVVGAFVNSRTKLIQQVAVHFKDGRKVLLEGNAKDVKVIMNHPNVAAGLLAAH
jgi:hypothetical protein